jgi:hypothetical protein
VRQEQEPQQETLRAEAEEPSEPRPDLRIVSIDADPEHLRAGESARLTVMLHNDSTLPAAGGIEIELFHDRRTQQPLPIRREILYLGPDGLTEVSFEVAGVELEQTPYTFYAMVDAGGAIDERDETDNGFWERFDVCDAPGAAERPDGYDNDCDGIVDDGLGLPPDTAAAVRMLRQMQRQASLDRIPLVVAVAGVFAPFVEEHPVRISRRADAWLGEVEGATPSFRAALSEDDPAARLTLIDWTGGELRSGDVISLRNGRGDWVVAEGGGGGPVVSRPEYREPERLFTIVRADAPETEEMTPDERLALRRDPLFGPPPIRSGDPVSLVVWTGRFIAAEDGGGRELRADREAAGGWETFTLIIGDAEQ